MKCPNCGEDNNVVVKKNGRKRLRVCKKCGERFNTLEYTKEEWRAIDKIRHPEKYRRENK